MRWVGILPIFGSEEYPSNGSKLVLKLSKYKVHEIMGLFLLLAGWTAVPGNANKTDRAETVGDIDRCFHI